MRQPTVSLLHGGGGYAVQVAATTADVPTLIPHIKEEGGTDIVITGIKMLVA